ncbi:probable serine/threonine-protein kinase clkA [Diabrotica virgifera virgifera]|uniref:GATA zinc finger domain-containing protein 14-like n=1 Tax=Diabrotica virgifera virgifera TaxID=50390 RepID=A0ABM5JTH2_DIAVI|nr:probable serine/threonine-protein kinase clkA [Diabrotica virgifera virgifera]
MNKLPIFLTLFIPAFGAKLNQYLPPRPENDNVQYQPPALPTQPFATLNQFQQQFATPNSQQFRRQHLSPNKDEESSQASSSFSHISQQFEKPSSLFGHENDFNGNRYDNNNQQYMAPNIQDASGQSSSVSGKFQHQIPFNVNGHVTFGRHYLGPNKIDSSGHSSNSFEQIQNHNSFNSQGSYTSFEPISSNQVPISENSNSVLPSLNSFNQNADFYNKFGHLGSFSNRFHEQSGQAPFNGQFSGSPSAPIGLIQNEFKYNTSSANNKYPENVNSEYQKSGPREQSPFASEANRQEAYFLGPKSFVKENNGYQYSNLSKSNSFADQGIFASQQSNRVSLFGGQQGSKFNFGQNDKGYQHLAPNSAKSNFGYHDTFSSQQSTSSFGLPTFRQQKCAPKDFVQQTIGYQYPVPEKYPFSFHQNKQVAAFGPQFPERFQYRTPEQYSSPTQESAQFNPFQGPNSQISSFPRNQEVKSQSTFQTKEQQKVTPGQFGTVQDSNGGYKY